jgi:predicted nucleic acid-binding protein
MKDKVFLDTNVILYAYSIDEPDKQSIAISVIDSLENNIISLQVINELSNILLRKFKLNPDDVENVILELDSTFDIVNFDITTQIKALKLKNKYNLQFYDSLIIATAIENRCNILYSEDMQDGLIVENLLTIVNPFK